MNDWQPAILTDNKYIKQFHTIVVSETDARAGACVRLRNVPEVGDASVLLSNRERRGCNSVKFFEIHAEDLERLWPEQCALFRSMCGEEKFHILLCEHQFQTD